MSEKLPPRRVLRYLQERPWAMLPSAHAAMIEIVEWRMRGERLPAEEEVRAAIQAARRPAVVAAPGGIAVLPIYGPISPKMDMLTEISNGTSLEHFAGTFRQAVNDPNIAAIVLDVDSPGGSVSLVEETANLIFSARGTKPIVAVANCMAASAAYFLAVQADELVVTPSGEVGSIGIVMMHVDYSKANEMAGLDVTYLTYGDHKAEGNSDEPLEDDAVAYLQTILDEYGETFVGAVARGRGVKAAKVKSEFGQGRMVTASRAVQLGMADREDTLQGVLDRLARRKARNGPRAETLMSEGWVGDPQGQEEAMSDDGPDEVEAQVASALENVPDSSSTDAALERAKAKLRLAGAGRAAT